jgi:transposase InsO family protein
MATATQPTTTTSQQLLLLPSSYTAPGHCQPGSTTPSQAAALEPDTLRRECLDHLLLTGPRHLAAVLREYVDHFNTHRPHRSLHQYPPARRTPPRSGAAIRPLRRDRLGGLVHEYAQVA